MKMSDPLNHFGSILNHSEPHHLQMISSEGFQHHLSILSKFVSRSLYMKKNEAFALISFAVLK